MEDQIKATIASANNHVLQAYNKLEELGATMPEHKNIENLRATVYTLPLNVPKVSVTFDTGEGSPVVEEVFPGQTVTKPADPTKENCFFLGWHKQITPPYDPENPTLAGLQGAMAAGDYAAFPVGTEIPDTWNGQSNPLIVAQYTTNSFSDYSYVDVGEGVFLVRKYVEPVSQAFGSSVNYTTSTIFSYLNSTYLDACSDELKSAMQEFGTPWDNGSNYDYANGKWQLMSGIEVGGTSNAGEGVFWDYWKQQTGLSSPNDSNNSGRIMKNRGGTAQYVWLRSRSTSSHVCYVYTNGSVSYGSPDGSYGVLPYCFIPKPSSSSTQSNAITAQEYNDKNITAQAYNTKSITAHDYNTNAKGVL